MSGQRWQEVRMVAFSVDILSAGSPSFCHAAMSASSVSIARGSRSGVDGIGTLQVKQALALLGQGASLCLVLVTFEVLTEAMRIIKKGLQRHGNQMATMPLNGDSKVPVRAGIYKKS